MYKYEMDPTKTVGTTEWTRDAGRTDGQMDGRTDGVKPVYPQQQISNAMCSCYNMLIFLKTIQDEQLIINLLCSIISVQGPLFTNMD